MGLRARAARVESHIHQTLNQGQGAIEDIRELAAGASEEVLDGFDLQLVVSEELMVALRKIVHSVLTGQPLEGAVVVPFIRVKLRED